MIRNTTGQTALLRSLSPGDFFLWYCDASKADYEMRKITAALHNAGLDFQISQTKALLIDDNALPQAIIIVTRTPATNPTKAINKMGKTDFLRSLVVGCPGVWFCDTAKVDPQMKQFTATLHRLNKVQEKTKITQKTIRVLFEGMIPQFAIVIERLPG